jgi:hypothetical protein
MTEFNNPRFADRKEFVPDDVDPFLLIPPIADFTTSITGRTVNFRDLSHDPDGEIVSWEWDFGEVTQRPTPAFDFAVNVLTVQFIDRSVDAAPGSVTSWLWDFGDGSTSTEQNPLHSYAAGGSYSVGLQVTDNDGNVSLAPARRTVSIGSLGRGFGPTSLYASNTSFKGGPFTGTRDNLTPGNIVRRLQTARDSGIIVQANMSGGAHTNYTTNGIFDLTKWQTYMNGYKTAAIIDAVAAAVEDGWLIGNSMVDEPNHSTWGGWFTKARIDSMAIFARNIFLPAVYLPMGVVSRYDFDDTHRYQSLDFTNMQYSYRLPSTDPGNVNLFISQALAQSALDRTVPTFGMNVLGGGFRWPEDPSITTKSCPIPYTGGVGENFDTSGNCKMTAAQIQTYGMALAAAGGILTMWSYLSDEVTYFTKADNVAAFIAVRNYSNTLPKMSLRRAA